jgi:GT2 family glycosyltransferase
VITASVVSHCHGRFLTPLVKQLLGCAEISQVLVTINVPEPIELPSDARISAIINDAPKGFGANHNAAFRQCRDRYFCVLNPDLEIAENPFPELVRCLEETNAAVAAPVVLETDGRAADSMRHFPTPSSLAYKALGRGDGRHEFAPGQNVMAPDWVAGMFMLFRSAEFEAAGGFDEGFFMYYEDVDICARLWKSGRSVIGCPQARVTHHAQRASRQDMLHARWHLASMLRFWAKHLGRLPRRETTALGPGKVRDGRRSELM